MKSEIILQNGEDYRRLPKWFDVHGHDVEREAGKDRYRLPDSDFAVYRMTVDVETKEVEMLTAEYAFGKFTVNSLEDDLRE